MARLAKLEAELAAAAEDGRKLATAVECVKFERDQQKERMRDLARAAADIRHEKEVHRRA